MSLISPINSTITEPIHHFIERHAAHSPNAVALIYKQEKISYRELNHAANAAALSLQKMGVSQHSYIPIIMPRSIELVISILAVLKVGAAYSLLDPNWPQKRITEIINDLSAQLYISKIRIDYLDIPIWNPCDTSLETMHNNLNTRINADDPCCIFFTSGTTGKPKGVISPHKATIRLFTDNTLLSFNHNTVIPLAAALPWDAFSLELWGALLNGGTAWIIDQPYLTSSLIKNGISTFNVNTIWLTSSLFNMIVDEDIDVFRGLHQAITGGEPLSTTHVQKFLNTHPSIKLCNGYGPVESTVFVTMHPLTIQDCAPGNSIPVGSPVPNTQIHIIDEQSYICTNNAIGEICISGEGLAIGYLNNSEQTNKMFSTISIKGKMTRIYRTGDLGFIKNDMLYCLGRKDRQVKIRGNRVELSEVEIQIEQLLDNIDSCKVVARYNTTHSMRELVAFCTALVLNNSLDSNILLKQLKSQMVHYQCPEYLIIVDKFPLTSQGKLDTNALLKLVAANDLIVNNTPILSPPSGNVEDIIINICHQIIPQSNRIRHEVPFSDLGFSSLSIGRLAIRIGKELNLALPLSWLYQYPTITLLS